MRLVLTDRFCSSAKTARAQQDFFDATVRGLALRVSATGHKGWNFHFTVPADGKRARLRLGAFPGTPLAAARARAMEARGMVDAGEDPRLRFQAAAGMTVATLIDDYLARHVRVNLRSASEVARRLRKNILPALGAMRLADLHRRDIHHAIDGVMRRGRPIEANRVFEDVRAMLNWAVARGDLEHSPAAAMKKPAAPRVRERALSEDEIRTLWRRLPEALARSAQCRRIVQLCLTTAQRVGEISGMRRDELDLRQRLWTIPGARTKNGATHVVPLSQLALDIIGEALNDAGEFQFVFPSGAGSLPGMAVAKTIKRAQGRIGLAPWTAHDLRRTALTQMGKLGVAPIVLGHIANHRGVTRAGVTLAVYVTYEYEAEKRAALELWADRLAAIITDSAGAVVPLRASRG